MNMTTPITELVRLAEALPQEAWTHELQDDHFFGRSRAG